MALSKTQKVDEISQGGVVFSKEIEGFNSKEINLEEFKYFFPKKRGRIEDTL